MEMLSCVEGEEQIGGSEMGGWWVWVQSREILVY